MRDTRKSLNNLKNKNSKNNEEYFLENPFILAIGVFTIAFFANYLLELDFTKNLFNWSGYYFDSTIYWLNSVIQPTFQNHPYIKIPVFTNPLTPDFMAIINPWMWLRGFILSSFIIGLAITLLQIRIIKSKNIVFASILAGICQLSLYALPYISKFSIAFCVLLIQKFYINILALILLSLMGLFSGMEYAIYLLRNDKVEVSSKGDGPQIAVKYTNKWE